MLATSTSRGLVWSAPNALCRSTPYGHRCPTLRHDHRRRAGRRTCSRTHESALGREADAERLTGASAWPNGQVTACAPAARGRRAARRASFECERSGTDYRCACCNLPWRGGPIVNGYGSPYFLDIQVRSRHARLPSRGRASAPGGGGGTSGSVAPPAPGERSVRTGGARRGAPVAPRNPRGSAAGSVLAE